MVVYMILLLLYVSLSSVYEEFKKSVLLFLASDKIVNCTKKIFFLSGTKSFPDTVNFLYVVFDF